MFAHECKKILCSLTFIVYCVLSVLFTGSQYYTDSTDRRYPPSPNSDGYGYMIVEDHDLIMEGALNSLFSEYASNKYVCYPFGFYKAVRLKEKKQAVIAEYLKEMTGTDDSGLAEFLTEGEEYYQGYSTSPMYEFDTMSMKTDFSYDRFTDIMTDVDDILGGGSGYDPENLVYNYSRVPMPYEKAVEEYNEFIKDDRITGGLARYFSDYAGIDLAILPVFAAAALTAADRKRRMSELIQTRKVSSFRLTVTRYSALVFMLFIPALLEMAAALIQALIVYSGETLDIPVMFTLPTFWLLPNVMFATAVGVLLTEVFSAGFAIIAQTVFWFASVMASGGALYGNIGKFDYVCRHNTEVKRAEFLMNWDNFVFSRIFWAVLSLVFVVLAALVYDAKRGGKFNGIRLFGKGGILRRKA